jgi:outer membrane protein assembly factor BamB
MPLSIASRRPPLVLVGLLLAGLVACGEPAPAGGEAGTPGGVPPAATDWNYTRRDPGLRAWIDVAIGERIAPAWTFTAGGSLGTPAVVGDTIYLGDDDGTVYALDRITGQERWRAETKVSIQAGVVVHDGRLFFTSANGVCGALDLATRQVAWTATADYQGDDNLDAEENSISGAPNLVLLPDGARVVFGSHDFIIYCHDAATGQRRWHYATGHMINGTPAVVGNLVMAGGCDDCLHVVDVTTGQAKSVLGVGSPLGAGPAVDGQQIYVGSYEAGFSCWDLATEKEVWNVPTEGSGEYSAPFFCTPALDDASVYWGGRIGKVYCADRQTGMLRWTFETTDTVECGLTVARDVVLFGDDGGHFRILDKATGKLRFEFEAGGGISATPVITGDLILVASWDGRLHAFRFGPG